MPPFVLSASRRTDIPAFYMPWFMDGLGRGFFEVINPYNHSVARVPADPGQVHSIVFWSKDFGRFIQDGFDRKIVKRGYRLFFNFTINSPDMQLEPKVPPLDKRLDQLARLCETYTPACVQWRFDPICYFHGPNGRVNDNFGHFEVIARRAAALGVPVCITSFVDLYRKVLRRTQAHSHRSLFDPPLEQKIARIQEMETHLSSLGMSLQLCCEKHIIDALPADTTIQPSACIPGPLLVKLYGTGISLKKDPGQRASAGCGCTVSRDIGSYHLHPCYHNCLFCYANPACDR
jgi:hypothetical protein